MKQKFSNALKNYYPTAQPTARLRLFLSILALAVAGPLTVPAAVAPAVMGRYDPASYNVTGLAVRGPYAYLSTVGSGTRLLDIVNITAPTLPYSEATFNALYSAIDGYSVSLSGNYAYISEREDGIQIVNVTTPTAPVRSGTYDTSGLVKGAAEHAGFLYLADGALVTLDVSDPSHPRWTNQITASQLGGGAAAVVTSGNLAFVSCTNNHLVVLSTAEPWRPVIKGACSAATAADMALFHTKLFTRSSTGQLVVIDFSNPLFPTQLDAYSPTNSGLGVALAGVGHYAVITEGSYLSVIDVSDVHHMTWAGGVPLSSTGYYVRAQGDYAYVSEYANGMEVVKLNIVPPPGPILTAQIVNGQCQLLIEGQYDKTYQIQCSTNSSWPTWNFEANLIMTNETQIWTDTRRPLSPKRLYRALVQ